MKTQISAEVRAVIELDEDEWFRVTGTSEFGGTEYTIEARRVRNGYKSMFRKVQGVEFSGRRVLKSGELSGNMKTVFVPDGDERIPAAVVEAVTAMRERIDHLESYIAEEA